MRSYKDIYVALGLLVLSTYSSWASFSALKEVERPLATYETPLHFGDSQFTIWYGDRCIGNVTARVKTEEIEVVAHARVSHQGAADTISATSQLALDSLGQVTNSKTRFVYAQNSITLTQNGTSSIELTFEAGRRSGQKLSHFTLPGPISVSQNESGALQIRHPYLSRSLRFLEQLVNNQFDKKPSLRAAQLENGTPLACDLFRAQPLEISNIVDRVSALTSAWRNLTSGERTHD